MPRLKSGHSKRTITVSGASPVVDVQNTRTQLVVSQDILQALPVMRSIQDQANLVPGVTSRSTSAGQILSDFYINSMAARGATDQHIATTACATTCCLVPELRRLRAASTSSAQVEMVYDVGGQSAEYRSAGVRMDAIPKDGGNTLSGTWRSFGSNHNFRTTT